MVLRLCEILHGQPDRGLLPAGRIVQCRGVTCAPRRGLPGAMPQAPLSLLRQIQLSVIRLSTSNSAVYFPTASVGGDSQDNQIVNRKFMIRKSRISCFSRL